MKNSFIAFALCMVGGQVHGVSSNNDFEQILCNVLVGDMVTLIKVRQSKERPSLGTVPKCLLPEINKYMTDLSWDSTMHSVQTSIAEANLPVARIKKDDTVVATRIDDNRHGDQVSQLISDLQDGYGTQVPIQVHTPHRDACFSKVTGKLYSDAKEVTVFNSHDLDMYMKPGGMLTIFRHSGHLRTNAHKTLFSAKSDDVLCNNITMICDNGNKEVTITSAPDDNPVTVKLDNFHGELLASGPKTTVKVQNSLCESAVIREQATALFDLTIITGNIMGCVLVDHASLVLFRSIVTGPINGTSNSDVFKVDSTGTVRDLNNNDAYKVLSKLCFQDVPRQCGDYTVSSKGNLAHVPALMAQEIARKNPDDTQKAADTVQKFDALWATYYMPNHNAPEESKE